MIGLKHFAWSCKQCSSDHFTVSWFLWGVKRVGVYGKHCAWNIK